MSTIFTKIINGEIPSHKVYEDDRCFAFLDIHPLNPGHTLLVPKQEVDHLWDLDEQTYHHLWDVSRLIARQLQDKLEPPRVGVIVEGFGVPHAHIHLIPLYRGSDIKKQQDLEAEPDHIALAEVASRIAL